MPQERILVAEDETDVRQMCLRSLQLAGYEALGVSNGWEAVERAKMDPFDLLLTDMRMPQLDGLEAYRLIRSFNTDIAAVVMTGYGTMDSAIAALQLGVSEFLIKPFRPDDLNAAIARALSKQRLERENTRLKTLIPLFDVSRAFMNSVDLNVVPKHIVRVAKEETKADIVSLMLLNDENELRIHSAEGLPDDVIERTQQKANEGIAGYVVSHREPVILQGDLKDDARFGKRSGHSGIVSAISLPIVNQDQVIGVLNVSKTNPDAVPFNESDVELLKVLASQAAVAIANARLFREKEEAFQRLSELDHLKSEFISIAAHELRSPLAVILSYATLLEEEATGPMREHLAQVGQASMQLKSIIDEMVSLRRIDTRDTQVHITAVRVDETVEGVLADLTLLAERKQQRITTQLDPALPLVRADQQVLHLILSNLISNAIKFTPEQGAITISADVREQQVVIAVSDTGIGIPKEELERIFQRFYQVEDSLTRRYGGIGLGLAIAREMATLIEARIWAESEPNQGSTFYVALAQA